MSVAHQIRILHLEDSPRDAELIHSQLSAGGLDFQVEHVENKDQYLAALAKDTYDLILIDYNMPGYDGASALRLALNVHPYVPIIMVSGDIGEETAIACLHAGATDYILKQNSARLVPAIHRALAESREKARGRSAYAALRATAAQLEQAQAVARLGSWAYDIETGRFTCSEQAFAIYGLKPRDFMRVEDFVERVHPEDSKYMERSWDAIVQEGRPYDVMFRILVNGAEKWLHERAVVEKAADGRPLRVVGMSQDITEREQDRLSLAAAEHFLRAVLSALPDRVIVLDNQGRIIRANRAAREYAMQLGVDAKDFQKGSDYLALCEQKVSHGMEGAAVTANLVTKLIGGQLLEAGAEYNASMPTGEKRRYLCRGKRFQHDEQLCFVVTHTDITDRVKAEEELLKLNTELEGLVKARTGELEQARDQAERANRAKSDFLAAMSHEIRTPMNGVIGMIDVLQQSSLRSDQLEMVEVVRDSGMSLLSIIGDILDYSKIEAGRLEVESIPTRVGEVAEQVCVILDRIAQKSNIELSLFIDPNIPVEMLGDSNRLRQVLVNLLGNAIKFSRGHVSRARVMLRATIAERTAGRVVVQFSVADNGIGMDSATLGRLFTPFTQADASTTRRFGGTGLGLAISRRLVELMGGRIDVQSTPGSGSVFNVQLPFTPVPSERAIHEQIPDLRALDCLVIGAEGGLADDIAAYLIHAGAVARREPDLATAGKYANASPPGLQVWIIDTGDAQPPPEALRSIAQANPGLDVRIVMVGVERGQRFKARRIADDMIALDGNVLRRKTLLTAVSAAAGRGSLDAPADAAGRAGMQVTLQSREETLRRGSLILVVEDNETNQKVILAQLHTLGFVADVAGNGREALRFWSECSYGLVLTDLHMPEMDGYQLTAAIRAAEGETRRTPIIALTANTVSGEGDRCREAGMDDYASKPLPLSDLKSLLEKWMPAAVATHAAPGAMDDVRSREPATAAPVDVAVLKKLVGDDATVIREVLQDFRVSAAQIVFDLRTACAARQPNGAGAAAHKLKSSARAVGALALGELCANMERAGKAGDAAALYEQLPAFEAEMSAVDSALARILATGPSAQNP